FASCRQHVVHPLGQFTLMPRQSLGYRSDLFQCITYTERIPYFERPDLPSKTCAHGIVDTEKMVREYSHTLRYVLKERIVHSPKQFGRRIRSLLVDLHPLTDIFYSFGRLQCGRFHFLLGAIFKCLEVERKNLRLSILAFDLLVKTFLGLLSQPLVLHHLGDKIWQLEYVFRLIIRH